MFATANNVGIVVVGTFKIHPDDRQIFRDIVISHIEETNAKDEALFYTFAQDVRDGSVFHILEGWTDKEHLDRYNVSPEFQETLKEVASKVRLLSRDANVYTIASQEFYSRQSLAGAAM